MPEQGVLGEQDHPVLSSHFNAGASCHILRSCLGLSPGRLQDLDSQLFFPSLPSQKLNSESLIPAGQLLVSRHPARSPLDPNVLCLPSPQSSFIHSSFKHSFTNYGLSTCHGQALCRCWGYNSDQDGHAPALRGLIIWPNNRKVTNCS